MTALEQEPEQQPAARLASRARLELQMLEQPLRVWPQAQEEPERQQARLGAQASEPLAARVLAQPRGHERPAREPGREWEERPVQPAWRWQARAQLQRAQPAVSPLPSQQTPLQLLPRPLHRQRRVWSREPSRLHRQGWSWNASSSR